MAVNEPVARVVCVEPETSKEVNVNLSFISCTIISPDQSVMSRFCLHRVFARWMVKVPRDRAKEVLLLDPGKWVGGRDGSGGEDGVVVAVEVDRVGNGVAAVRIHQEQLDHLGERQTKWEFYRK